MFDIGFAELLIIAVVGLLVIGPQRLPETVRALALWIGRLRRAVSRTYRELEKEVGLDDIRRQLHNEEIMRQLNRDITADDSKEERKPELEERTDHSGEAREPEPGDPADDGPDNKQQ